MSQECVYFTLAEAIRKHKLGFFTTTGLVKVYFEINGQDGTEKASEIAKTLGISESSYYKALKTLRKHGVIQ